MDPETPTPARTSPPPDRSPVRTVALVLWLLLLVGGLALYFLHRERFTPEAIAGLLRRFSHHLLLAYLVVSVVRAFFLVPSTPFVLAGGLLFPDQPGLVLAISMVGIALSATLLYGFSDWLGIRNHLERVSAPTLDRLESALRGRHAFLWLVLWSFFPFAPTDAACYVAGMVRMRFWKFLAAICLGELIICSAYVLLGRSLGKALF